MSQVTGTIEAISTKYDKFSILIEGTWYATKAEWAPSPQPNKGDTVTFDNGGKKFIKKLTVVSGGGGSGGAASSGGGSYKGNLGVEVGHAANLAIQVVNKMVGTANFDAGSEDYYKEFTRTTQNMYRLMHGIRESCARESASAAALAEEAKPKAMSDESDLF